MRYFYCKKWLFIRWQ